MKLRNPWIDPRVAQVKPADVQQYLLRHGWKALPEQDSMLPFEGPPGGGQGPTVRVPVKEQARDYTQRVIELITDLALAEDRYAVDVLTDVLGQASFGRPHAIGPTVPAKAESVPK
jgi:hypothetical protein